MSNGNGKRLRTTLSDYGRVMKRVLSEPSLFNDLTLSQWRALFPDVPLSNDAIRDIAKTAGINVNGTKRVRVATATRDQFRQVCRILRDFATSGEFSETDKLILKQLAERSHTQSQVTTTTPSNEGTEKHAQRSIFPAD